MSAVVKCARLAGFAALAVLVAIPSVCAAETGGAPVEAGAAPADDVALKTRGLVFRVGELMQQGQMAEAERIARQFISDYPDGMPAKHLLTSILIERHQFVEARRLFEAMLARNEPDFQLYNNYAWFLATVGDTAFRDPPRALALAQDALMLAPETYQVWSTLSEAHYVNGNFEQSIRAMSRCIELALRQKAPTDVVNQYQSQINKVREAATVMSLIE